MATKPIVNPIPIALIIFLLSSCAGRRVNTMMQSRRDRKAGILGVIWLSLVGFQFVVNIVRIQHTGLAIPRLGNEKDGNDYCAQTA